ncbi:hypothetical protein O7598_02400 [Micromonospora sp. WMMC241]|uniref:hypothetical protein n=1 Tax=Micromonospora sp. WMMC241 TaxID=3015159 RepID=UPI0022B62E35|nr:hypothetical protein [Micromonospora sp. WMMC241]MCZ7435236.1 hypothetical protein [Micromonospora sp. WMMC241]
MFKEWSAGTWLLIGLVGSVLLRGTLWVITTLNVAPLLGPAHLLLISELGRTAGTATWLGDIVASFLFAVATGVVCIGLRRDRVWARWLGAWLARFYVALNAGAAVGCAALLRVVGPAAWLLVFPFALYVVSLGVAIMTARQLKRSGDAPGLDADPAVQPLAAGGCPPGQTGQLDQDLGQE